MRPPLPKTPVRALLFALMFTTTLVCSLHTGARAMIAPAAPASGGGAERAADMRVVQTALESKALRQRLKDHGLTDREIETRLSRLSDSQIHSLAKRIDAVAPGGDASLIGILFVLLLVLLIVYLAKRV